MEQKRSIRLVLKTSDLTANSTTTIGQCDQFKTTFTWFNINLRILMGDLYDQYDYFNLSLISISSSGANANAGAGSVDDRLIYIKLGGLPFVSQSYNQRTGNTGGLVTIGTFQIPTTAITANQFYNNSANVCTFNTDQDLCNFTISFFRILDDTKPVLTLSNPNFAFIFVITGIDKPDNPDRINHLMKIN
jgi:hypothetical protein